DPEVARRSMAVRLYAGLHHLLLAATIASVTLLLQQFSWFTLLELATPGLLRTGRARRAGAGKSRHEGDGAQMGPRRGRRPAARGDREQPPRPGGRRPDASDGVRRRAGPRRGPAEAARPRGRSGPRPVPRRSTPQPAGVQLPDR